MSIERIDVTLYQSARCNFQIYGPTEQGLVKVIHR